ncbi:MAG TPA: aminoacyl-tRNA hydrolase [Casimicrobiaceae bacterium]
MTPLRLIVGIGNPGSEYRATRHNAGAWFVERLAQAVGASLGMQAKFQALVGSLRANDGIDRRLALPQTFVNRSGQAVSALARFYRIAPEEILIAHDELDLKPGAVKLKEGGGSAGHNGLKDIAASLGTPDFWRLRIGIGHPREGALSEQEVADYVLHRPRLEEQRAIDDAIVRALAIWPSLEAGDTERAMHLLHTVPKAPKVPQTTEARPATANDAPDSSKPPAPAAAWQDSTGSSEEKGSKAK